MHTSHVPKRSGRFVQRSSGIDRRSKNLLRVPRNFNHYGFGVDIRAVRNGADVELHVEHKTAFFALLAIANVVLQRIVVRVLYPEVIIYIFHRSRNA